MIIIIIMIKHKTTPKNKSSRGKELKRDDTRKISRIVTQSKNQKESYPHFRLIAFNFRPYKIPPLKTRAHGPRQTASIQHLSLPLELALLLLLL